MSLHPAKPCEVPPRVRVGRGAVREFFAPWNPVNFVRFQPSPDANQPFLLTAATAPMNLSILPMVSPAALIRPDPAM